MWASVFVTLLAIVYASIEESPEEGSNWDMLTAYRCSVNIVRIQFACHLVHDYDSRL